MDETNRETPVQGKRLVDHFKSFASKNSLPIHILEDHELLDNVAEVHRHEDDLWICLEGEA